MTSKRLSLLILSLALVWSVAGIDWFGTASDPAPRTITSIGTAYAGAPSPSQGLFKTLGDPDDYTGSPDGDPDDYVGYPTPPDSTGTEPKEDRDEDPDGLLDLIGAFLGAVSLLF